MAAPQGKRMKKTKSSTVDEDSPVMKMFLEFQNLLDTRHDKHERLVKLSRDVTIDSKRSIFGMHRVVGTDDPNSILDQTLEKLTALRNTKLVKVAEELDGEDPYQFLRAYSPGLQEFIEALTFYHFLRNKKLVSLTEIQEDLVFSVSGESEDKGERTVRVHIPPLEYMLGVADLTGELMRLTINSVGAGDLDLPFDVCIFIRRIYDAFLSYGNTSRELSRKMSTLRQSLQKVESACYTIQVRGSEIPKHMLVDVLSGAVGDCSSGYHDDVHCDD